MSPLPVVGDEKENPSEVKSKPIGVIIPPPDIRKIADKTAEYVAKNGSAFEDIVMKSEASNPKFSFLKQSDPYRAYYDQKVVEFAKGIAEPEKEPVKAPLPNVTQLNQKKDIKKEIKREIKPPPSDRYTVYNPSQVELVEMDIIKLTAQFVAKNGQSFLVALTEREKQNPQFDFLKPTHQLFSYFTSLVEAYSKCINPSKDDILKLQHNATNTMTILNRAGERFEYELNQTQAKKKKEELDEEERMQMAQIDWNDFVVVETIDLFDHEELPAPNDFSRQPVSVPENELAKRAQINDPSGFSAQLLPSSIPSTVLQQIQPEKSVSTATPAVDGDAKIKKEYVRKTESKDNSTTKCPNCGQYIPVSEFNEHYRIEMLHPNYKKIKDEVTARATNTTMVSGDEISQNLSSFAQKRPDLFGDRPKNEQEESNMPKVIWSGQSENMTRTTATHTMFARQQMRHYGEQMQAYKEFEEQEKREKEAQVQYPLMQLTKMAQTQASNDSKPTIKAGPHLPEKKSDKDEEPDPSKIKAEEASLIPEQLWLSMNTDQVMLQINIPGVGEFTNKHLKVELAPSTKISYLKEYISKTTGIPSNKMKLKSPHLSSLKDDATLAFYNFLNGTVIEVAPKEKGGKSY